MSSGVDDGEKEEHVRGLSMKPQVFIQRKEADLGTKEADHISTYSQHDQEAVQGKDKSSATRNPYTEFQSVQ